MSFEEFSVFGDDARLWIYPFRDPLEEAGADLLRQTLDRFLPGWVSHGAPVEGQFRIHEHRFVLLVGHSPAGISGCSIDSSAANFKNLRDHHGLDGLDRSLVFFRDSEGNIQGRHFLDFKRLAASGRILAETPVFDTTITTLGQLRRGEFEKPFGESWHAARF